MSKLRLTPLLPRSVGLGPVFFPAQRRFGHRPVHTQPLPVNATEFIKLLNSGLPECEEDSRLHPLLKAIMGCRVRTQLGLIQGLPLATRSQHVEDGIGTVAIRHPWASSPKAMGIHMHRQQRLQLRPQLIRDAKSRRRAIIRGPLSFSFSFLGFLSVHTSYFTTFSGYSDRHFVLTGGRIDLLAYVLAGFIVLMALVQLRLAPLYFKLKFSPGFWSFTFSYAATAAYALRWIHLVQSAGAAILGYVVLAAITLFIGGIALRSLVALQQGKFLPAAGVS